MRKTSPLLLLLFTFASFVCSQAPNPQKQVVFTHVTVIDATGAPPKPDVTVIITNDRISEMGDAKTLRTPKNSEVVDATGKFLIPGLWDMHAHWQHKDYLPLFIANGVTGIRIMWGTSDHYQWRKEIESGQLLGPRMVIAGTIIDGPKPMWPGSLAVSNEAQAREAVTKVRQEHADFVKIYSFLPREEFFAIADEARKQGIPFVGHVPFSVSASEASDAGQKSMEHLLGILPACSAREAELLKAARSVPSFRDDARLKYMPRSTRASWDPLVDPLIHNGAAEDLELGKSQFQKNLEIVGAMHRAGVGLLAGTDVANAFCFPGFSLHDELALLVQSGLSPMAALQTATRNPARFLGKEKDLGTIEQGKLADLVLLDANPLDDIRNTTKIAGVVVAGKYFSRASVQDMLAKAQALASRKSIADPLLQTIREKNAGAAVRQYHELKTSELETYDFGEDELNTLGYQLIAMKRFKDSIEILKLNVEAFPTSSNAYDSLGEAYMDNGDKEQAIKNYEKSLALDRSNKNAVEMLKKLNVQ
jgi:imidazolonepropionase-like amidohydrolase